MTDLNDSFLFVRYERDKIGQDSWDRRLAGPACTRPLLLLDQGRLLAVGAGDRQVVDAVLAV